MLKAHAVCQISLGLAILSLVSVAPPVSAQVRYSVVDLGVLEQASSNIVRGFNSANEVGGGGNIGSGRGKRAFLSNEREGRKPRGTARHRCERRSRH